MGRMKTDRIFCVALMLLIIAATLSGCKKEDPSHKLLGSWRIDVSRCSGNIYGVSESMNFEKSGYVEMINVVNLENGQGYRQEIVEYGSWEANDRTISITGPHGTTLVAFKDIDSAEYEVTKPSSDSTDAAYTVYITMPNGAKVCYNIVPDWTVVAESSVERIDNR